MKVFDLELDTNTWTEIVHHTERDYPREACGVILGKKDEHSLARACPLANVQDRLHRDDPVAHPHDARDAFCVDELERMRLLEIATNEGLVERIIYHSHCDAGAYFSPQDRAMTVHQGIELMPGVVHVVVSVRGGRAEDAAAFRYDRDLGIFREERIPLDLGAPSELLLPDLSHRAMEAKGNSWLVPPVGGLLNLRRLSSEEATRLAPLAEGRRVILETPAQRAALKYFELGFYAPLEGFMRGSEVRSVRDRGRLHRGTPWRTPLTLDVKRSKAPADLEPGLIIELLEHADEPLALMAVQEAVAQKQDRLTLAGPVYVYPKSTEIDAADRRAMLLRAGARRTLAILAAQCDQAAQADLEDFDVVLAETEIEGVDAHALISTRDSPWLTAAMAQNQGATHIWVEDASLRRQILDSLEIEPWEPK